MYLFVIENILFMDIILNFFTFLGLAFLSSVIAYSLINITHLYLWIKLGTYINYKMVVLRNYPIIGFVLALIQILTTITFLLIIQIWYLGQFISFFKFYVLPIQSIWLWAVGGFPLIFYILPNKAIEVLSLSESSEYEYPNWSKKHIVSLDRITHFIAIIYLLANFFSNSFVFHIFDFLNQYYF